MCNRLLFVWLFELVDKGKRRLLVKQVTVMDFANEGSDIKKHYEIKIILSQSILHPHPPFPQKNSTACEKAAIGQ